MDVMQKNSLDKCLLQAPYPPAGAVANGPTAPAPFAYPPPGPAPNMEHIYDKPGPVHNSGQAYSKAGPTFDNPYDNPTPTQPPPAGFRDAPGPPPKMDDGFLDLPTVPSNTLPDTVGSTSAGGEDVDFDDLTRRFEALKKKKWSLCNFLSFSCLLQKCVLMWCSWHVEIFMFSQLNDMMFRIKSQKKM